MKISLVINTKNPNKGWLAQGLISASGFDEKIVYYDGELIDEISDGKNRSIPEGFNHAIGHATGDWICAFCDDDYFDSANVQKLINQMREGHFSDADIIHFPIHTESGSWGCASVNKDIFITNQIPFSSFYRREVFEKLRGYHTDLKVFHDWNFWLRAYKAGFTFKFFPEPVYTFRMGHESASNRQLKDVGGKDIAAEMVRLYA